MATFTLYLVLVAAFQFFATIAAFTVTLRAANAAKKSAETADQSLKLAMTGVVGIKGAYMSEGRWAPQEVGASGYPLARQPTAITVGYTLFNASAVPITMTRFEARYRVSGDIHEYIHQIQINERLTPGKGHQFPLPITELDDAQQKAIMVDRLTVSIHMTVSVTDPLERTTYQEFRRRIICRQGDRSQSLLWDGNPDSD